MVLLGGIAAYPLLRFVFVADKAQTLPPLNMVSWFIHLHRQVTEERAMSTQLEMRREENIWACTYR